MAGKIVINMLIDDRDIERSAKRITKTLGEAAREAGAAGRKITNALAPDEAAIRRATEAFKRIPAEVHRAMEQSRSSMGLFQQQARSAFNAVGDSARLAARQIGGAMAAAFDEAQKGLRKFGEQARTVGTALTAGITLPLAAGAAAVIKVGLEYEKALNTFGAVTNATAEEMRAASQAAKQLGADASLPATSAADAALAMSELGKAGLTARQAMDATRGTLLLAAAAQIEAADAAEITANALNAFGLQASEAGRVADLLAGAANASSAGITEIAQAMQQSSASAAALRLPIEDLVTSIGLMANSGIKGSDAGTSLKTALTALAAPTDKAADAMRALGINAFDSQGKLLPLRNVIDQFSGAFAKLSDQQKLQSAQTIFGSDAMRAALIVFGGGTETFDKLKNAVTAAGAAAKLAGALMSGVGGAIQQLKSQLETGAIELFERFKGQLETVVKAAATFAAQVVNVASKIAENNPAIFNAAAAFTAVLAVLGPITLAVAGVATAIGAISGPFLAAAAALTAGAAAIAAAWTSNFGNIRGVTQRVLGEIVPFVKQQVDVIVGFWRENLPQIQKAVQTVLGAVRGFWKDHGDEITAIVRIAWDSIKTVISAGVRTVLDAIRLAAQLINNDWSGAWKTFHAIVSRAFDATITLVGNAAARIPGVLIKGIVTGLSNLEAAIKARMLAIGVNMIDGLIEGIKSKAASVPSSVGDVLRTAAKVAAGVLEARSPSRVYYRLGEGVGEGFALGVESKAARVRRAIREALEKTIPPDLLDLFRQDDRQDRIDREFRQHLVPSNFGAQALAINAPVRLQPFDIAERALSIAPPGGRGIETPLAQLEKEMELRRALSAQSEQFALQDNRLRVEELRIQNLVTAGTLNEAQGKSTVLAVQRQYRDAMIQSLEASRQLAERDKDPLRSAQFQAQIESLRTLGLELTPMQSLLKGLRSESETLAEQFERVGVRLKDSIFGQLDRGIESITRKLGFFRDVVGDILKSLARNVAGGLLGGSGGGASSGGLNLGNIFSGIFGGGGQRNSGGFGGFLTPSFAGGFPAVSGGGAGFNLPQLLQQTFGLGAGITAPPSISDRDKLGIVSAIQARYGGVSSSSGVSASLRNLFQGFGFGKAPGSGGGLAGLAPLLGLSLGSGLGGILGGAGGLLAGIGLTAAPSFLSTGVFASGAALGGLGKAASFLFSNPFTAAAGAAALVGSFFLARAAQRRRDESTSGDYLQQAVDAIHELREAAQAGQLSSEAEARSVFESQIMATFIQQVNTIRTASVRQSRLTNQTRDLRNLFESSVIPHVKNAVQRQVIDLNLIPEFHIGGISPREQIAKLLEDEMVLTVRHQRDIKAAVGFDIFKAVGVPDAGKVGFDGMARYHDGGRFVPSLAAPAYATPSYAAPSFNAPRSESVPVINVNFDRITLEVGKEDATRIVDAAAESEEGYQIFINQHKRAKKRGEIK